MDLAWKREYVWVGERSGASDCLSWPCFSSSSSFLYRARIGVFVCMCCEIICERREGKVVQGRPQTLARSRAWQAAREDEQDREDDGSVRDEEEDDDHREEQADGVALGLLPFARTRVMLRRQEWRGVVIIGGALDTLWNLGRLLLLPSSDGRVQGVVGPLLLALEQFLDGVIL
eukprot:CAMPEP_0198132666 /NCGR_PEP_ID=MMETSP1442-20131203/58797_1 /TAXON_ID= /ORGANISM="Craspedostauros australis, Strain CCMP3328" /LENGTH=173 /DNA_ID=CAMNT_0043793719 /DNA_START=21 /DNA_END=539 /DNA_ORIENTATION=-